MLEIGHRFECVTREGGKRTAEAHHHQNPPPRIYQYPLGSPDDKEADDKAACKVDQKRSVGKNWAEPFDRKPAQQITQVCTYKGSDGNCEEVLHDGILSLQINVDFVGVISPHAKCDFGQLWRTPSP